MRVGAGGRPVAGTPMKRSGLLMLGCLVVGAAAAFMANNFRVSIEPSGRPQAAAPPNPYYPPPNRLPESLTGASSAPFTRVIHDPAVRQAADAQPTDAKKDAPVGVDS